MITPNNATIEEGRSAPVAPLPSDLARKPNVLHQQILGSLLANKPRTLANNVSDENINRMAKRWIR